MDFDATTLRDECRLFYTAEDTLPAVVFGEVKPGEYPTQRGSFDICSDSTTITVCVWSGGRVEILSLAGNGETKEIETLEDSALAEATASVRKHIAKYV